MIRRLRILATLLLVLPATHAPAALHVQMSDIDARAGVAVDLACMLDQLPGAGFAPLRITVRNDAKESRSWNFSFESGAGYDGSGLSSRTAIEVAGRSEKTVEFLVPITPTLNVYSYPNLQITCSGPGGPGRYTWSAGSTPHMGGRRTPAIAVADDLATPIWSRLQSEAATGGVQLAGSPFDAARMPADPLAWIGWDIVWLSDHLWSAADAAQRRALLDWVKLGGHLIVVTKGATPEAFADLPAALAADLGGGSIDRVALPDLTDALLAHIWAACTAAPSTLTEMAESYTGKWPLSDEVPAIKVRTGPILLFVGLFALLIGPVNLLVLARRQQHMHLFWTTPLLALIASLLLGLVIVLQDGFGGNGTRATFVYLDPEGHQACIWQEQISRTGVLLDRSFTRNTPYYLADLPAAPIDMMDRSVVAELQDERWSGAWFASRQVQSQYLAASQPTRARVRIDAADPARPRIISELPVPLVHLYYVDATGGTWQAGALLPGTAQPLQRADAKEYAAWRKQVRAAAGPLVRRRLPDNEKRNWFFAEADQPSEQVIDTLASIRWKQRMLLYHGPVQPEAHP